MMVVPWLAQGQAFNYTCDFDNSSDTTGWVFVNGSQANKWCIGTAAQNSGTSGMYISNNDGVSNAYYRNRLTFSYAYQEFTLDSGRYIISYDWRANGEVDNDYLRVFLAPSTLALTAGQDPSGGTSTYNWRNATLPAGCIDLAGNRWLNLESTWVNFHTEFVLDTGGAYRLVFAWASDASHGGQPPAAIDNISFGQPSCPRPSNLTFTNVGQHSFDVSWQENGSAIEWLVQVDSSGTTVFSNVVDSNAVSITSRAGNIYYVVSVLSICDITDTSWVLSDTVFTPCLEITSLPFYEDFEWIPRGSENTGSSFVSCWHRLNNGTRYGGYPYVSTATNHTPGGTKGLEWYNYHHTSGEYGTYQCVVLPPVDTNIFPINTLMLRFWARASNTGNSAVLYVGVLSDPTDINTFQTVDTIHVSNNDPWTEYASEFTNFSGHGQYVAIQTDRSLFTWRAYIDDISLMKLPSCPGITNLSVHPTAGSALLEWDYDELLGIVPVAYNVNYGYAADSLISVTTTATTDPRIVLTGLTPDTTYAVSISVQCDSSVGTASVFNFSTPDLPCLERDSNGGMDDCLVHSSCVAPYARVDSVFPTKAYLSWIPGYWETSWNVEYRVHGTPTWTIVDTDVTSLNYILSGLAANTDYEVRIGTPCDDSVYYNMLQFRTECATPVPFTENFENWTSSSSSDSLPLCWSKHTNTYYDYPRINTNFNHTPFGNKSMYMYSNRTSWCNLVLPQFTPPVDSLQIRFWLYKDNTDYSHTLIIGVMTDPDDDATFVPLDTVRPSALYTWQEFTVPLNHYSGRGRHIAILSPIREYSYPYLDDLIVEYIPDCMSVYGITASNITQTSADLTWIDSGATSSWSVEYGVTGFTRGTGTMLTVYDTTITLAGLTANTNYTVYITPDCPEGIAATADFTFSTPCYPIGSLPWSDDLESYPQGNYGFTSDYFIPCYHLLNNGTQYGGYPYLGDISYNHTPDGSQGLYWLNISTPTVYGDYQYVVLPELDSAISLNTVQLSFWARSTPYCSHDPVFRVGVMTDPTDISTFVEVRTTTVNNTAWSLYEVPLSGYTGNGHYVAIMADRSTANWSAHVDDISLDYAPTCIAPRNIVEINATVTSITLDWLDITPAVEWQVEYGPQGYTRGSSAGTSLTAYAHPFLVTGLDTLVSYDFYVRPICAVGDTAEWSSCATLTTTMCDTNDVFSIGSASSRGTTYLAPVNNYYRYTLSEVIVDSAELGGPMDIDYIGYYYDYPTPSTSKTNCTIYFQPTTKTFFGSTFGIIALNPATAIMVYTGPLNCSRGWNYFPLLTTYHYNGIGNLVVIVDDNSNACDSLSYTFRSEPCTDKKTILFYSNINNPDATIPSLFSGSRSIESWRPVMQFTSCAGSICHQPVIVDETHTDGSATIVWGGEGSNYEVSIKDSAAAHWPDSNIAVTGNSHTFTGLAPATKYTFRVRQDCNADSLGYSRWVSGSFVTDSLHCTPPVGFSATDVFGTTATFDWVPVGSETRWNIHVWFSGGLDSIYTVRTHPVTLGGLSPNTTYYAAIRPLCGPMHDVVGEWGSPINFTTQVCPDVTGLGTGNVTSNSVELYWTPNPMAVSWIIEYGYRGFDLGTGTTTSSATHRCTVNGLIGDMQYDFHVRAKCGADWQSEGWASTTATTQPGGVICNAPTDINTVVAGNVATVSWTASTDNISFELEYGPQGFSHGAGTFVSATSSSVTLPNLDYATDYDVYVRAICDQGTYSGWSAVASFTTNAVGIDGVAAPACTIYPNPTRGSATITVTGISGKVRISVVDIDGREVATETLYCIDGCAKTMEVGKLAQGAYFVRITSDNANIVKKLIVR